AAQDAARSQGSAGEHGRRENADVRGRARARALRCAGRPEDPARRGRQRLPVVVGHSRHRSEHTVSNAEVRLMIVLKKAIPRRTVLRGLGAAVALPLLDSMVPVFTAIGRTAAAPIKRFGVVYVPNGVVIQKWTPAAEGAGFEFTPILKPLEPFR